jgi:hypothetical protein
MRTLQNLTIWACDVCESTQERDDQVVPPNWISVVFGRPYEQLGNKPEKHLCSDCSDAFGRLMSNTLGDVGDMAEAWREGWLAMGQEHIKQLNDPKHPIGEGVENPYGGGVI